MVNLKNLKFFNKIYLAVKNFRKFVKLYQNIYKTVNKSVSIHTNQRHQIFLSSNRLKQTPKSFTHVFKNIETTMR